MSAPAVSAYPYARWPRVSRVEARGLRKLLRSVSFKGLRSAEDAAEALLGAPVRLAPGLPEMLPVAQAQSVLRAPVLAVALECVVGARSFAVLCELPPALGAALVDRVLGGQGQPGHAASDSLDDLSAGTLAYLAARMAGAAGGAVRVRGVITDAQAARALLGELPRVLVFPFALELDGMAAAGLRAFCDPDAALALSGEPRQKTLPDALRAAPIALCAHAATITLTQSELRALAPGDVIVPERCALARHAGEFVGQVELHVSGGRHRGFACSARGNALRIEKLVTAGERSMTQGTQGKRIQTEAIEAPERGAGIAADAPIELCLELARFTLPLDEVAALRPGEVLSTGRAIGERVTLRTGGRAFAYGELVEIDGEVGVRITELS